MNTSLNNIKKNARNYSKYLWDHHHQDPDAGKSGSKHLLDEIVVFSRKLCARLQWETDTLTWFDIWDLIWRVGHYQLVIKILLWCSNQKEKHLRQTILIFPKKSKFIKSISSKRYLSNVRKIVNKTQISIFNFLIMTFKT